MCIHGRFSNIQSHILGYGVPINGTGFINWLHAKYLSLQLLHHPFALQELYVIALFYFIYLLC